MDNTVLICGLAIFALPLFSFAVLALFNHRMPRRGDFIATGVMGVALFLSLYIFWRASSDPKPVLVNISFAWLPMQVNKALLGGILIVRRDVRTLVPVGLQILLRSKAAGRGVRYPVPERHDRQ